MPVFFERRNNELLLCYSPVMGISDIERRLSIDEEIQIKRTFFVTKSMLREPDNNDFDFEDTLRFCIGHISIEYTQIYPNAINTDHRFYFSNDITLSLTMFVAYRNISILKKIDKLIEDDFYIGGNWESKNGISVEAYRDLINCFPKTAELDKYANSRIANILKEFFPGCDKYEEIYKRYIERKRVNALNTNTGNVTISNLAIELAQFSTALGILEEMLSQSEGITEPVWQERIQEILQLLYPKYILCTREITLKGVDGYDKRPDFLLVDTNGFVDILEIKKPNVQVLTKQASYRNNYVPVKEFAGAIQQIEKYIFCLTSLEKGQKEVLERLSVLLPDGVNPEIVNPQGILLLGRSRDFNAQQKRDFELIKRQYKNITDIMTYDDLLQRLRNVVIALEQRIHLDTTKPSSAV